MFEDTYKSAYGKISPGQNLVFTEEEILKYGKKKTYGRHILRPAAIVSFAACFMLILGLPVAAKNIPDFYEVLERRAPGLLDYLIPVQQSDSSQGIILNLEAAYVEGNRAEILVSFADDGSGDYIQGMVDMYDSYHLKSYDGENNIGGCSFVEYNEEQDKAYFQIDLISEEGDFDASRMEFSVTQLLTDCQSSFEEISLENLMTDCNQKIVSLNGYAGMDVENPALDKLSVPGNAEDPRPGHSVLDIPLDSYSPEDMEITAVAYMDGILRIQLLRGNFKDADRHMRIFMMDESGSEVYPDMSVMWHDTIAGEEVLVDECYFVLTEEESEAYTLWGEGEVRAGSVEGNWSITFDLE